MTDYLDQELYAKSILSSRKVISVIPITFGRARLCTAEQDSQFYDDVW